MRRTGSVHPSWHGGRGTLTCIRGDRQEIPSPSAAITETNVERPVRLGASAFCISAADTFLIAKSIPKKDGDAKEHPTGMLQQTAAADLIAFLPVAFLLHWWWTCGSSHGAPVALRGARTHRRRERKGRYRVAWTGGLTQGRERAQFGAATRKRALELNLKDKEAESARQKRALEFLSESESYL
jgi:hypothetical protein